MRNDTIIPQSRICMRDYCVNKIKGGSIESSLRMHLYHWTLGDVGGQEHCPIPDGRLGGVIKLTGSLTLNQKRLPDSGRALLGKAEFVIRSDVSANGQSGALCLPELSQAPILSPLVVHTCQHTSVMYLPPLTKGASTDAARRLSPDKE